MFKMSLSSKMTIMISQSMMVRKSWLSIFKVIFDIDFEIKNKFLNSLMAVSFKFGLEKIADAFQKRAKELFTKSKN